MLLLEFLRPPCIRTDRVQTVQRHRRPSHLFVPKPELASCTLILQTIIRMFHTPVSQTDCLQWTGHQHTDCLLSLTHTGHQQTDQSCVSPSCCPKMTRPGYTHLPLRYHWGQRYGQPVLLLHLSFGHWEVRCSRSYLSRELFRSRTHSTTLSKRDYSSTSYNKFVNIFSARWLSFLSAKYLFIARKLKLKSSTNFKHLRFCYLVLGSGMFVSPWCYVRHVLAPSGWHGADNLSHLDLPFSQKLCSLFLTSLANFAMLFILCGRQLANIPSLLQYSLSIRNKLHLFHCQFDVTSILISVII